MTLRTTWARWWDRCTGRARLRRALEAERRHAVGEFQRGSAAGRAGLLVELAAERRQAKAGQPQL